jgi:hypothetical protein
VVSCYTALAAGSLNSDVLQTSACTISDGVEAFLARKVLVIRYY